MAGEVNQQVNVLEEYGKDIGDLNRRVRLLEERLNATRERLDIMDDSMRTSMETIKGDVGEINSKIEEIGRASCRERV